MKLKRKKTRKARKSSRNQESKEPEYFRGIIRELEKQVRSLQAEIKRLIKHEHMYENLKDGTEEINIEPIIKKCNSCKIGNMIELHIAGRIIRTCDDCGKREKAIKIK